MPPEFQSIFTSLRSILQKQADGLSVKEDSLTCYSLAAKAGPAAIQAWGGKVKRPMIPVAWVQIGKAYVSYHLMGLYGNAKLGDSMSKQLKARLQGKTCFNFKTADAELFAELDQITAAAITAFRKAGFTA